MSVFANDVAAGRRGGEYLKTTRVTTNAPYPLSKRVKIKKNTLPSLPVLSLSQKRGSEQTFLPKIGADSVQFSLKIWSKIWKMEEIGIKTQMNDLNNPGDQP